jgi:hypothetical protein
MRRRALTNGSCRALVHGAARRLDVLPDADNLSPPASAGLFFETQEGKATLPRGFAVLRVPACLRGFAGAVGFAAGVELLGAREAAFLVRGDIVRELEEQKIDLLGIAGAVHAGSLCAAPAPAHRSLQMRRRRA